PRMLAKRSWPLEAKPAIARPLPEPSCFTSILSAEVKNQIGARRSSAIPVIGRAWPSSRPSRPSITVRSLSSAFQNFSSSSRGSVIGVLRLGEPGFKHCPGDSHVGTAATVHPAPTGAVGSSPPHHPGTGIDEPRHRRLDGLGHPAGHAHPPEHHPDR